MPVPNEPSRAELDALHKTVVSQLLTALDNLGEYKRLIDGYSAEQLLAAPFSYAQADVDNIKALAAQHPLILATQPMIDALTFGRRIAGINLVRR